MLRAKGEVGKANHDGNTPPDWRLFTGVSRSLQHILPTLKAKDAGNTYEFPEAKRRSIASRMKWLKLIPFRECDTPNGFNRSINSRKLAALSFRHSNLASLAFTDSLMVELLAV